MKAIMINIKTYHFLANFKRSDKTWKIQRSVETKFRFSENTCEEPEMYLKSENITIMVGT